MPFCRRWGKSTRSPEVVCVIDMSCLLCCFLHGRLVSRWNVGYGKQSWVKWEIKTHTSYWGKWKELKTNICDKNMFSCPSILNVHTHVSVELCCRRSSVEGQSVLFTRVVTLIWTSSRWLLVGHMTNSWGISIKADYNENFTDILYPVWYSISDRI